MDKQILYGAPEITLSKSYDGSADLNRGFLLLDQNSTVSSPSLDLRTGHRRKLVSSSGIVVEYAECNNASEGSWIHSPSLVSLSLSQNETVHNIPIGSKFSTPCEGMNSKKAILASSPNLSCLDPSASRFFGEHSLIRHGPVSPRLSLESSLVDGLTWSPRYPCPPQSLAEISSLLGSATPPNVNVSREPVPGPSQSPAVMSAPCPDEF
ncbi:hypothetical protein Z043_117616 [Scleropages formosus]|uniref:Uncharacterized protein n=1 Tax=Scleropages formosus TaxID=113540 RepID=A0A0P7TSA0_SCLFO|nr:uncharacterized protein LOC108923332 [Scleropages formosus]KPP64079.1 hypothetical protein Z043_117616 [Scleropages formosus]